MKLTLVLMFSSLLIGCAGTDSSGNNIANVRLEHWDLSPGYAYIVEANADQIRGISENDFGDEPETLWERSLDVEQYKDIASKAAPYALGGMRNRIDSPYVSGGWMIRLTIKGNDGFLDLVEHENYIDIRMIKLINTIDQLIPSDARKFSDLLPDDGEPKSVGYH